MIGAKIFLAAVVLAGLVFPVAAFQMQPGADVANNLINATGTRVPELLIMLFSFGVFSTVVYFFIKSLDKKDKVLVKSQEAFQDTITNMHNSSMETISENTKAHHANLELTGRVLQKLDDMDS